MASTRIHIDEARLGRVQKQDRIATGVLTAIVAIVILIVASLKFMPERTKNRSRIGGLK